MTDYRSFDRTQLISRYGQLTSPEQAWACMDMTRQELIDMIHQHEPFKEQPRPHFPPNALLNRQRNEIGAEMPFTLGSEKKLYFCWEPDAIGAAAYLDVSRMDQRVWNIGEEISAGTMVLTVLATTPPLVMALETVNSLEGRTYDVRREATFAQPISLLDLEQLCDSGLPRSSQALNPQLAERVLKALTGLVENPRPLYLDAGACRVDSESEATASVHALALAQRHDSETDYCDGCQTNIKGRSTVHFFRDRHVDLHWDIQDHVDDAALLCADCHRLMHAPTLKHLQRMLVACPGCGARNPKEYFWGMPAFPPDEEEYVVGGCAIPNPPVPRYSCRNCELSFGEHPHWVSEPLAD